MFLRGHDIAKFIVPVGKNSLQPAGIDLRLGDVKAFDTLGVLDTEHRYIPPGRNVKADSQGFYYLKKGSYRIRFSEIVKVPSWAVGFCFPRSSLLRMGALIHCAVWDPGYKGRGEALLVVFNDNGIKIRKKARVAQIVFARLETLPYSTYKGKYLYEGL